VCLCAVCCAASPSPLVQPLLTDVCFARSVGQPGPGSPGPGAEGTPTTPEEGERLRARRRAPPVYLDPATGVSLLSPVKEELSGPLGKTPQQGQDTRSRK